MQKFRGGILLIAGGLAIYAAITRAHGWYAVLTAAMGVIVGIVGILRIMQKQRGI
jgi:hypothetical protein